mmetsp:Transcript_14725/g.41680  ORF Transcript_14725/g.41680 Transcript_14725/m.41680 type:complete len:241 (+) Transcript_14725:1358-2080(+)
MVMPRRLAANGEASATGPPRRSTEEGDTSVDANPDMHPKFLETRAASCAFTLATALKSFCVRICTSQNSVAVTVYAQGTRLTKQDGLPMTEPSENVSVAPSRATLFTSPRRSRMSSTSSSPSVPKTLSAATNFAESCSARRSKNTARHPWRHGSRRRLSSAVFWRFPPPTTPDFRGDLLEMLSDSSMSMPTNVLGQGRSAPPTPAQPRRTKPAPAPAPRACACWARPASRGSGHCHVAHA